MYVSLGGDRVNLDIYYKVPRYNLDMELKQMRSDCDVIDLIKCYDDLLIIVIYIKKGDDLLSVLSPDCARHTMDIVDDEVDVNVNEHIQNSDALETNSDESDYRSTVGPISIVGAASTTGAPFTTSANSTQHNFSTGSATIGRASVSGSRRGVVERCTERASFRSDVIGRGLVQHKGPSLV
ncbi:unnamed protein product [Ilex paraguariensis]|uniref:Uncharacterized protein n=1 Tax=Ilex paraguariensis TaxID=185542 RepID=A0ABC8RDG6_9AQUA